MTLTTTFRSDGQWRIWERVEDYSIVLQHPAGARAFFSMVDIAKHCPPGLWKGNIFDALLMLIQNGLRPYKVEGWDSAEQFALSEPPRLLSQVLHAD